MPPLTLVAVAWVAGLLAARFLLAPAGVEPASLALFTPIPLAAILFWRRDRAMVLCGACTLVFVLGAIRCMAAIPKLDDPARVAHYNDRGWVTLEGVVRDYPDRRDTWAALNLDVEKVEIEDQTQKAHGAVLVRAARYPEYGYGDRIRASGLLQTPPELAEFSYRAYLANRGIHSLLERPRIERIAADEGSAVRAAIFDLRDRARELIARLIPDPEASLLQGILLGIRSGIPAELYDDYNATGTSHIIVISGANITIVAGLFVYLFGRLLGKRRAYWLAMAGILLYVLLVGADPVVVRAGVMGALFITAIRVGRAATAYVSLMASVILLTLINPLSLWDVGFQLSFAATLGMIFFAPPLQGAFEQGLARVVSPERARHWVYFLNDALIITLAAQVLVVPLILHKFGRVSLVAPLANLLILPVQPPIMILGGLATLTGLLPPLEPVAQTIAWAPWLGLAYTNTIVRWLAGWPFASVQANLGGGAWLVGFYGLLLASVWVLRTGKKQGRPAAWNDISARLPTKPVLGILLVAAILSGLAFRQLPDGRLRVAFLDVGQGDAIFITTPRGQQILVDGGPSPPALTAALGQEMPFWDRSIDLVAMTHPDADHSSGLVAVLERYEVGAWLDNGSDEQDAAYLACLDLLERNGVPRHVATDGFRADLGQGLTLEVVHPQAGAVAWPGASSNDNSLVQRLNWQQVSFLLTGDLEAAGEASLLQSGHDLAADVLKVAHHGSGGSSTEAFLAAVAPEYAVVSAGADNRFGHPDPEVLARLEAVGGVTVLRTDRQGTVTFLTDGQRLWVETER
jgi:competence protein ComEC